MAKKIVMRSALRVFENDPNFSPASFLFTSRAICRYCGVEQDYHKTCTQCGGDLESGALFVGTCLGVPIYSVVSGV